MQKIIQITFARARKENITTVRGNHVSYCPLDDHASHIESHTLHLMDCLNKGIIETSDPQYKSFVEHIRRHQKELSDQGLSYDFLEKKIEKLPKVKSSRQKQKTA